jgi:hypothetical protein
LQGQIIKTIDLILAGCKPCVQKGCIEQKARMVAGKGSARPIGPRPARRQAHH